MSAISDEMKRVLNGIRTEIVAGSVTFPKTEDDRLWNRANDRAVRIIDGYLRGEGLFQMVTTVTKGAVSGKANNEARRNS